MANLFLDSGGYDAIQLAASLELFGALQGSPAEFKMVCADDELNAAASVFGMSVENPNLH
jgi:hypothetical protein